MEVSRRYNLRPRPRRINLCNLESTHLVHPVSAIKSTFSQVLPITVLAESADISDDSDCGEQDWVYVRGAPINVGLPSLGNPVGVSTPVHKVLTTSGSAGETERAVPGAICEETSPPAHSTDDDSSEDTLSGRRLSYFSPTREANSLSSSETDVFATAQERVNLEDFATANSVLRLPVHNCSGAGSSDSSDTELEPSTTSAFQDLIALTTHTGCRQAGVGFGDPNTWDTVAHVLLPRVVPITGPHTRSRGPTVDVPLPLHCPVSQQLRGQGEDRSDGNDDDTTADERV